MIKQMFSGGLLSMFPRRQGVSGNVAPMLHPSALKLGRQIVQVCDIDYALELQPIEEVAPDYPSHLHRMPTNELRGLVMKTATGLMSARAAGLNEYQGLPTEEITEHLLGCFATLDEYEETQRGGFLSFEDIQAFDHPDIASAINGAFAEAHQKTVAEHHGIMAR
jgi:hypothetical protein